MSKKLIHFLHGKKPSGVEIISGTARGAADWNTYGKSAGYRRNADMAKYADAAFILWDGESKGTKHMIDLATKEGLEIKLIKYKEMTNNA